MMAVKASKIATASYNSFCDYLRISPDCLEKIILNPDAFIERKFSLSLNSKSVRVICFNLLIGIKLFPLTSISFVGRLVVLGLVYFENLKHHQYY